MKKLLLSSAAALLLLALGCSRHEDRTRSGDSTAANADNSATAPASNTPATAVPAPAADPTAPAATTTPTGPAASPTTPTLGANVDAASREIADHTRSAADQLQTAARNTADALSAKLNEWNLSAAAVRQDLENSGRVVRSKSEAAASALADAADRTRIRTTVNAKYAADSQLSASAIDVKADGDVVTLTGTVDSAEQVGRAVALALDTDGVRQVVAALKVNKD